MTLPPTSGSTSAKNSSTSPRSTGQECLSTKLFTTSNRERSLFRSPTTPSPSPQTQSGSAPKYGETLPRRSTTFSASMSGPISLTPPTSKDWSTSPKSAASKPSSTPKTADPLPPKSSKARSNCALPGAQNAPALLVSRATSSTAPPVRAGPALPVAQPAPAPIQQYATPARRAPSSTPPLALPATPPAKAAQELPPVAAPALPVSSSSRPSATSVPRTASRAQMLTLAPPAVKDSLFLRQDNAEDAPSAVPSAILSTLLNAPTVQMDSTSTAPTNA